MKYITKTCLKVTGIMNRVHEGFEFDIETDELREDGQCVFPDFSKMAQKYWHGEAYFILFYDYLIRQLLSKYDKDFMLNLTIQRGM